MANSEPLTFEEFTERTPFLRYNNFYLYFSDTEFSRDYYRNAQHFRRFKEEHSELERES